MKIRYWPFVIIIPLVLISFSMCAASQSGPASYDFTSVRRGNVERTVSSSGTINPVATVKVLPRMSGKVENVFVDFNDEVSQGQILAVLNTDMLRLQRDQQASSVQKARANYELQLINFQNQQALFERNLISEYEYMTSRNTLNNQAADLAVAETNLRVIETEINQYAYITSPIDGIVLDRRINIGDTVVESSGNIFVIAENLREMQIEATVGELDVASIYRGQPVRFSLESLPNRNFFGLVENVRMIPAVSGGIVSYTVIISAENHDGSLLPGMTCAVEFIVESAQNALLVQNAALRYQPTSLSSEQISEMVFNASLANMGEEQRQAAIDARNQAQTAAAAASRQSPQGAAPAGGLAGLVGGGGARMISGFGFRTQGEAQGTRAAEVVRNLWFFNDEGKLDVIQVRTGISDGSFTEVFLPDEYEGRQFILRERL